MPPRPAGHDIEALTFDRLEGFAEDDLGEAFRVFRLSSAAIAAALPLRPAVAPPEALVSVCRQALAIDPPDGPGARRFFEAWFLPCKVVATSTTDEGTGFFTGYYEPVVEGSLTRSETCTAPLLAWPEALARRVTRSPSSVRGPLPDRATIEALARAGRIEPIVWVRDPVEAFFVQVQGSARVRLVDGTELRLVYAGRNGHPYTSIGRLLVEAGEIALADMSLARLKAWIRAHGQEVGEAGAALMQHNESYVFFRVAEGLEAAEGPIGGQGIGLTPLRSIAVDRTLYPYGLPVFVSASLPWQGPRPSPFRRLMIAQDTGSAIVGPARADIFFGTGDDAGARAGDIRHAGDFIVLLPKEEGPGR